MVIAPTEPAAQWERRTPNSYTANVNFQPHQVLLGEGRCSLKASLRKSENVPRPQGGGSSRAKRKEEGSKPREHSVCEEQKATSVTDAQKTKGEGRGLPRGRTIQALVGF